MVVGTALGIYAAGCGEARILALFLNACEVDWALRINCAFRSCSWKNMRQCITTCYRTTSICAITHDRSIQPTFYRDKILFQKIQLFQIQGTTISAIITDMPRWMKREVKFWDHLSACLDYAKCRKIRYSKKQITLYKYNNYIRLRYDLAT